MAQFIASIADALIYIFLGLFILYLHTKKKVPLFSNKKWAWAIAIILFGLGGYDIYDGYVDYEKTLLPSLEYLEDALASKGILAEKDFIYDSPDGFQVLIPGGYRYVSMNNVITLIMRKKIDALGYAGMAISKLKFDGDLPGLMTESLKNMKLKEPTYSFSARGIRYFGRYEGISCKMEVIRKGIPLNGIIAFCRGGNFVYQVLLYCPKDSYSNFKLEFEKILDSFRTK